jgi:uracil-DNA glycosylase
MNGEGHLKVPENFRYYLSAHRDCTERLLAQAEEMSPEYVELSSDPVAVRIRKMVNMVRGESHRMKGFVRLKALGDKILYGYMKPQHRIGDHVCDHFARRSPDTIIVLGYSSQSWISLFSGGHIFRCHGGGIDDALRALQSAVNAGQAGSNIEKIWEIYYASQYCPERRNLKHFSSRMPKKALKSAGLSLEGNKNGKTLQEFFEL